MEEVHFEGPPERPHGREDSDLGLCEDDDGRCVAAYVVPSSLFGGGTNAGLREGEKKCKTLLYSMIGAYFVLYCSF